MNRIIFILIILTGFSCKSTQGPGDKIRGENVITKSDESDEYELTIIDPGFDQWFAFNKRPVNFHSLDYYERQNQRYVQAWNLKVNQQGAYPTANYPFENHVNYDSSIDYGMELNYKLYYYFKYIEDQFGDR